MSDLALFTKEEALAAGYIALSDAAKLGLGDRSHLWRRVVSGDLAGCQVKRGSQVAYYALKSALTADKTDSSYEQLHKRWITEQENGYHTGKPLGENSVESNRIGLQNFWKYLSEDKKPMKPHMDMIYVNNLRRALSSVQPDHDNQKCHYSLRKNMYFAFRSFYKLLIEEGLRPETDLALTTRFKPKRIYKPVQEWLEPEEIRAALKYNSTRKWGRTQFHIDQMEILIYLYAFAGLRKMEAARLERKNINLKTGLMKVFGKGGKERYVIILPELAEKISWWMAQRKEHGRVEHALYLLADIDGQPLKAKMIQDKFDRFAETWKKHDKNFGRDIKPHMLRRACLTILRNEDMPMVLAQEMFGHEDSRTTEGYDMTNVKHLMKWAEDNYGYGQEKAQETPVSENAQLDMRELTLQLQQRARNRRV